jgi:PhzF family phenazine biosynthesis protein
MKKLDYYVLDVFADQRYTGNQLSVVYCNEPLTLRQYHEISREFGYSETSFIHYSEQESVLIVRSFTPAEFEVVGAGHNLLGAVCLALLKGWNIFKNQHDGTSVMIGGIRIPLKICQQGNLPSVSMRQQPAKIIRRVPMEIIAPAVGLRPEDLSLNGWDASVVETEVAHLMIPVKDQQTLRAASSAKARLKELSEACGFEGSYLFTTNQPDGEFIAETRFFNPGIGIDEDPATGTAAGPLSGYLATLGYLKNNQDYKILQGTVVQHPSIIQVYVASDGVWVSGTSVIVMEGKIYV